MKDFGLYAIMTSPRAGHRRFAEICVEEGVCILQLREKNLPDGQLVAIANDIRAITKGTGTSFVVNDRADIAARCHADGLHLGQSDMDIEKARDIFDGIIGLSTHSIRQAKDALEKQPDYIGFGPVYATPTKAIPDPVVGTELLAEVARFANIPVVAIGGIFPENLPEILRTGARNVALVRFLMEVEDPRERIRFLQKTIQNSQE